MYLSFHPVPSFQRKKNRTYHLPQGYNKLSKMGDREEVGVMWNWVILKIFEVVCSLHRIFIFYHIQQNYTWKLNVLQFLRKQSLLHSFTHKTAFFFQFSRTSLQCDVIIRSLVLTLYQCNIHTVHTYDSY